MKADHSQNQQLGFISDYFHARKNGIFVDCGILDGIRHSNTYDLEIQLDWTGLLIEASPRYMEKAKENRSAKNYFINKALYHTSGKILEFNEVDWSVAPGLSGLVESYNQKHIERVQREAANHLTSLQIETITLDDALKIADIQTGFEFLKLDLEGGELNALKGFDICYWKPQLISCEINYEEERKEIMDYFKKSNYSLLSKRGGDYFFSNISI